MLLADRLCYLSPTTFLNPANHGRILQYRSQQPLHCALCGGKLIDHNTGPALCEDCSHPAYEDPKLAAACIILIDGKLLLVRRAIEPRIGKWSFPSGYVNRGEDVELAAAREVEEETYLHVRINWNIGVYSEAGRPVVLAAYDATMVSGELAAGDETSEVGLFDLGDLPELAFEHDTHILKDWRAERGRRGLLQAL
jgi:ADP-ribose pyrophosphatase YjhB (NUDIX family)